MKQKTVKFVGSSNSYTHTKLLRVVKFCVIMAMFLSYSYQAKSQSNGYDDQIVGPASAVENQIVNYATAAYVQQSNCHPVWTISGGTIIGSATSHNISVKWLNGGTTGTLSFSTWGCTGVQVACCQVLEVIVYTVTPPPASVTVSGKVTQCNNLAVAYADITGAKDIYGNPIALTTDINGNYVFETALGTSLSLSASQPNRSFTTINLSSITTNRVANISKIINYSVPTITRSTITCQTGGGGISANTCTQYSGFVVGESYYSRYRNINGVVTLSSFIANSTTITVPCCLTDGGVVCYYWACGSPCSF